MLRQEQTDFTRCSIFKTTCLFRFKVHDFFEAINGVFKWAEQSTKAVGFYYWFPISCGVELLGLNRCRRKGLGRESEKLETIFAIIASVIFCNLKSFCEEMGNSKVRVGTGRKKRGNWEAETPCMSLPHFVYMHRIFYKRHPAVWEKLVAYYGRWTLKEEGGGGGGCWIQCLV